MHSLPHGVVELDLADGAADDGSRVGAGSYAAGGGLTPRPRGLAGGQGVTHHHVAGLAVEADQVAHEALLVLCHHTEFKGKQ